MRLRSAGLAFCLVVCVGTARAQGDPAKDAAGAVKDAAGAEYSKWVIAADYASGKNAIGGGGFGTYYYFTKDISLLTGPVWFNEKAINGATKWTTQLDLNF